MTDNRHHLALSLFKLFDLLAITVSFCAATVIVVRAQHQTSPTDFLAMRAKISNVLIFLLVLGLQYSIFRIFGLYRSRRLSSRSAEIADVLKATLVAIVCFRAAGWIFGIRMLTPHLLLVDGLILGLVLCASRVTLRALLVFVRVRGRNLRYLLILGTNPRAVAFARKVLARPELGYRLLGFVDDDWHGVADFRRTGFRIVSDYAGLPDYLRRNVVDEAVIYLPLATFFRHWSGVASLCQHNGIIVRMNSDTLGFDNAKWLTEEFGGCRRAGSARRTSG